ncbi:MAG: hypothetical protein AAF371_12165 [Pseudomonadota bacterium]
MRSTCEDAVDTRQKRPLKGPAGRGRGAAATTKTKASAVGGAGGGAGGAAGPMLPRRPVVTDLQLVETALLLIEALQPVRVPRAEPPSPEVRAAVEAALLAAVRPEGGRQPLSEVEGLRLDLIAHAVLLEAVRREVGDAGPIPRADRLDQVAGEILSVVAAA